MVQARAGVIGLGNMGLGMATTLAGKGFAVIAHDAVPLVRERAAKAGIAVTESLAEVFAAPVVVLSLPTAAIVEAVVAAAGEALAAGAPRRIVVDTSTSEPAVSRRLAADLAARGHGFLDAPVSGGPAGAAAGSLAMMIGGDARDLADARPVIDALAARVVHVGGPGAGNVAKLVNNLLVAAHMLTTAEALRLAQAAGVPAQAALEVINGATGRSAISEVHVPTFVTTGRFDSGFSAGLMRKDVRLALALAGETGVSLPIGEHVGAIWRDSVARVPDLADFTRLAALDEDDKDHG